MPDQQQEILLEKFFLGNLSREEETAFHELMQEDEELRKTVEAQETLMEGLGVFSVKDDLRQRFAAFHEEEEVSTIPLWQKRGFLGIAASVLLIAAFSSYASYKLGWLNPLWINEPKEQANETPNDAEHSGKITGLNYVLQTVTINPALEMEVEGGLGTVFRFPAGSLQEDNGRLIQNTVSVELIEILQEEELAKLTTATPLEDKEVIKAFFFFPYHAKGPVEMNSLNPPLLILPGGDVDYEIWYGGEERMTVNLKPVVDRSAPLIEEPTKEMDDFRRFLEGNRLLDSLDNYYHLKDGFYKPNNGRGMEFTEGFVKELESFVNIYQNNPSFSKNIMEANRQWRIYQQQRTFQVEKQDERSNNSQLHYLYEPGWYIVVQKEK